MMSSKDLLVGSDGQVLVVRFRRPTGIEFVAYRRKDQKLLIRKIDGQLYAVAVTEMGTPIEMMAALAASDNPVEELETQRKAGKVMGAVQYLSDDPFVGEWAPLVQTAIEKAVSIDSVNNDVLVLEI
ncbi:hypothetical protein [Cupriavidus sp. TMH.W2]|uniref:hypothetical protein n=1 Tax=Cupriavidus sp. TMH.W2 TaxID=3434465 RepID=UPI003D77377B